MANPSRIHGEWWKTPDKVMPAQVCGSLGKLALSEIAPYRVRLSD